MHLDPAFFASPIAHRALHDLSKGRPENSLSAIAAAVENGYGIEIDVQLSKDQQAMVFHDYSLGRLTGESGPIAQRNATELSTVKLAGGDGEGIPTLAEVLAVVSGKVPLLIEIKDQDGANGPNVGILERAVAHDLEGYAGPVALMSFNPHSVAEFAELCPMIPRGIVTSDYVADDWPTIPKDTRDRLRDIPDYDRVGACFISHEARDLQRPRVAELKAQGASILCWTIRSVAEELKAREIADNITFEGYLA